MPGLSQTGSAITGTSQEWEADSHMDVIPESVALPKEPEFVALPQTPENRLLAHLPVLAQLSTDLSAVGELIVTESARLNSLRNGCDNATEKGRLLEEEISEREAELERYKQVLLTIGRQSEAVSSAMRQLKPTFALQLAMAGIRADFFGDPFSEPHPPQSGTTEIDPTEVEKLALTVFTECLEAMRIVQSEIGALLLPTEELRHQLSITKDELEARKISVAEITQRELEELKILDDTILYRQDQERASRMVEREQLGLEIVAERTGRRAEKPSNRWGKSGANHRVIHPDKDRETVLPAKYDHRVGEIAAITQKLDDLRISLTGARDELGLLISAIEKTQLEKIRAEKATLAAEENLKAVTSKLAGGQEKLDNLNVAVVVREAHVEYLEGQRALAVKTLHALNDEITEGRRLAAEIRQATEDELAAADTEAKRIVAEAEQTRALAEAEAKKILAAARDYADKAQAEANLVVDAALVQADAVVHDKVIRERVLLDEGLARLRLQLTDLEGMLHQRNLDALSAEDLVKAASAEHLSLDQACRSLIERISALEKERTALENSLQDATTKSEQTKQFLASFKEDILNIFREIFNLKAAAEIHKTEATGTISNLLGSRKVVEFGTAVLIFGAGGLAYVLESLPIIQQNIPTGKAVTAILCSALLYSGFYALKYRNSLKASEAPRLLAENLTFKTHAKIEEILRSLSETLGTDILAAIKSGVPKPPEPNRFNPFSWWQKTRSS